MQLAREFRKQECCSGTEAALHSGAISAAGGDLISTGFRLIISRSASGSPESSLVKISSTSTVLRRIKGHKIAQKNCIQESNVSYRQLTRGIRKPVARDSVLASGACAVRAPGRLPWKDGRPAKAHRGPARPRCKQVLYFRPLCEGHEAAQTEWPKTRGISETRNVRWRGDYRRSIVRSCARNSLDDFES